MWVRLQGNADAMHMLQTSHAFWVGPPLFGWGDFTLLSWANSKSLCNSTNMRLNCLFPWYLATFGTTASPTLASQTFLKAGESFWAWAAFGLAAEEGLNKDFFHMLKEIDEESTTSEHAATARLECDFDQKKYYNSSYIGKESQEQAWTRLSLVKDCAGDAIQSSLQLHVGDLGMISIGI